MINARCLCGFTEDEAAAETIGDHLFDVFAPDDGKGPGGKVHMEGEAPLYCLCGQGGSQQELDAHWLEICTPADAIGRDGISHQWRAGPALPTSGPSHLG